LHNRGTPHGPDVGIVSAATQAQLGPVYFNGGLAFMFETCYLLKVSSAFRNGERREVDYTATSWGGIPGAKL